MVPVTTTGGEVMRVPAEVADTMRDDSLLLVAVADAAASLTRPLVSTEQYATGVRIRIKMGLYSRPEYLEYYRNNSYLLPAMVYQIIEKKRHELYGERIS